MGIFDRIDRIAEQLGDLIVPDDVRAHVELGAAYLDRGDLDAAVTELSRAVELRPDHPRALYLLGVAYARRGDENEAISALERAATARRVGVDRPGFAEAWLALADVHRRRGDDDGAVDAYRAALDAGVGDSAMRAEIYRGLGSVYLRQRRYDKAVRELRKAVAATPDDAETQGLLGRALYLKGDYDTARLCLERAAQAARPDPLGLASLGDLFERLGRVDEARDAYERALKAEDADVQIAARLGLARLALAMGDAQGARVEALRALERDPSRPDILTTLGRVYAAGQQWDDALAAYDRALVVAASGGGQRGQLMLFDRRGLLEEALRAALRAGATSRANNYATSLLADVPEHPDALAATARAAADGGELDRAQALVERAIATSDSVEARLAAADVALKRGQPTQAAAALRRAAQLQPDDPRPRARLASVYREGAPPSSAGPAHELYALLSQAHRLFARTHELAEWGPEASRLVEVLDRPLLVTVMGEFNSGKSTFVNALIGEEVAPMGITPTTATINVLKYGTERKGRVVYHDDEVREVAWGDVPKLLKGLDAAEAKRIRVVEVLYPLETLQRVNVVDTPGLNSIHPEHEETARKFIAEADAVLWLFTVDQAAKATEGEALGKIKAAGKKILGVLNKIDRCSPEELARIVAHVSAALGEHLETIVPFAAREALRARKGGPGDDAQLAASNYPALASALEERFFSRARAIKREAATTRLRQLITQARAVGAAQLDRRALEPIAAAEANVRAERVAFERDFIVAERRRLNEAADGVYGACAREVLDFVRPRRWPFGSNEAAPADRDFLIQLLDERLGALLDQSRARTEAEAQRAIAIVRAVDDAGGAAPGDGAHFDAELTLLGEQVFGRFRAFARGYLRGGRVDDFFTRVLPKLELAEAAIQRALERDAPWSDDVAEAELRAPLRRWAERFYGGLLSRLQRLRTAVELDRLEIEERLIAPVEQLSIALDSLS
ncbi:MAG TPA: tetratricopeptide repeat protein [Polyangia bacterium]|nr:tetratricopeptide repeat protein [Polyangia bacterium]